jgi:hypothetical protein
LKSFLDSGVLMTAWKGAEKETALAVIEDTSRPLLTSELVRLELLPKPVYFKRHDEVAFYEKIFSRSQCDPMDAALYGSAFELARRGRRQL